MFHYKVVFTLDDRRRMVDCQQSITFANAVARRKVTDGATDVVITVEKDSGNEDKDDPSWPPLDARII